MKKDIYIVRPEFLNYYTKQKEMNEYEEAIKKQTANQKAYDDLLNFDVNAGQDEINNLEAILKKANELNFSPTAPTKAPTTVTRNGMSYSVDSKGNYSITPSTGGKTRVEAGYTLVNNAEKATAAQYEYLKENGYSSIDELKNAINQKKQYLNDAKSTQSTHAALSKYNKTKEEKGEEINSLYTDMGTKKANYEENGKSPFDWISKGIAAFMYGDSPKNIAVSNEENEYMSASEKYYTAKYGTKAEQQELLNIFKQSGDSKYSQEITELTHSLYGDSAFDEYIGGNIEAGAQNFFYETAATFNAITSIFGLPIDETKAYQDLKKSVEAQNTYASNAAIALGDTNNLGGNLMQLAMAFIPDLIIACATKCASGGGATTKGLIKIAKAGIKAQKIASINNKVLKYGSGMLDAVSKGISATAKNPMFWTSFSRTFGTDYETALEGGADTTTAYLYATITSITNALVEIGGGVEKRLPDVISGKSKFQILDFIKECIEEGNEEVIQGVITNLNQLLYDSDKEFFSLENEEAIINPRRMLKEHAMGTLGGAVLGGGTKIGQRIISGSTRGITLAGKSAIRNNIVSDLAEFGRTAADENVRAVSESFLTSGKITNYDAGVLFAHAQKQINYDLNLAKTPAKTRTAIKKYIKGNYPEAIKQMVIGNEIAKMYDISGIASKVSQREYSFSTEKEVSTGNDIQSDVLYPTNAREASAFNRSLANQTSNLKNMKKSNIMIYTADYAYFVTANGYMSGKIIAKKLIDGNEEIINKMRKEFKNGTFESSKRFDLLAQSIRNDRGRGYRRHASLRETLAAGEYGDLDGKPHIGNGRRGDSRSDKSSGESKLATEQSISVRSTSRFNEPDLTAQKPQSFEEMAMENITGEKLRNENQKTVESIARLLNQKVEWYESADVTDRGYYENGVIHINKKANQPYTVVFTHEFLHHLQNTKVYAKFTEFVMGTNSYKIWISQNGGYDAFSQIIKTTYEAREGKPMSETRLRYEIMARFISEGFFTVADFSENGKGYSFFEEIAQNHKWYHRVMDWFAEMINRLKRRSVQADFIKMQRLLKAAYDKVQSGEAQVDGGREWSYLGMTKDNRRVYKSGFDSSVPMEQRIEDFKNRIATIFNLGAVTLKTDTKKIQVRGDKFTSQKNLYGNKVQKDYETEALVNSLYDLADILSTAKYLPNKTNVEPSYANSAVSPKNAAHKDVKYWYKFQNEIVFDGVPYTVTFNIRDKGKEQYQYLIEFKENRTPGLSNTAVKDLLRTDQMSYDINVPQKAQDVNTHYMQNSRDYSFDISENLPSKLLANDLIADTGSSFDSTALAAEVEKIYAALDEGNNAAVYALAKNVAENILSNTENGENWGSDEIAGKDATERLTNHIVQRAQEAEEITLEKARNENQNLQKEVDSLKKEGGNAELDLKQIRAEERQKFEAAAQRRTDLDVIKRTVNRIDTKLRQNSNAKHVPKELRKAAIEFCSIFAQNDTSVFDSTKIWNVRKLYDALLKKQKENGYGNADPDILEDIQYIGDVMQNRRLISLNKTERETVRRIAEHLEHLINKTNEIFIEEKKLEASKVAEAEIERLSKKSSKTYLNLGDGALRRSVDKGKEFLHVGNKKTIFFFEEISGVLEKLYKDISNGFDKAIFNLKECSEQLQDIIKKHDYKNWLKDKKAKYNATKGGLVLKKKDGQQITVAPEQVMSIYAIHLREEANQDTKGTNHLKQGGIVLATREIIQKIKGDTKQNKKETAENTLDKMINHGWFTAWASKPYRIDDNDIKQIKEYLGKDGMAFVEEMVHWLSTVGAQLGNEASMKLYNINKFGETYYFPIETSSDYLARQVSEKKGNKTLAGSSFAKNVTEKANTPIVVGNFLDICADHMIAMCAYNALTVPIDNFKRIWNYSAVGENGEAAVSLRNEIKRIFGQEYADYIDQFIKDVDGGIDGQQPGDSLAAELIGKFKKNAVVAKLSVAIQQPSSLLRAMIYIEPKYLFSIKGIKNVKETFEECMKYNSVAIQKEIGRFDVGNPKTARDYLLGTEYNGAKEKIDGFLHDENYRDDVLGKGPEYADKITWCIIWKACCAKKRAELKAKANTTINAVKKRITQNMSDSERYEILKDRSIKVAEIDNSKVDQVLLENPELLDKELKRVNAEKILRKVGEEFEVFGQYQNPDIELNFEFGKNNLSESLNKQKGDFDIYAQMLSCFPEVINNAVGIEVHNRNSEGYKYDATLKNVYVLCSAFYNGTEIIPVKLEVKEFSDKPNRLYLAVSLEGIKNDRVAGMGVPNNRSHVRTSPVNISIREMFEKINPKDKDFIKYIPDEFFNPKKSQQIDFEEQVKLEAAKLFKEVIEHTQVYDSVLSRSQNMRSKSRWTQIVTSFMGEPTVNLNLLLKAFSEFKNGNRKFAGKIVGSIIASTFLNALLKSLVTALGDDDEDKSYVEKYVTDVGINFWDDIWPHTWVPLISDVDSIWKGYKIERADMGLVQDLYNGLNALDNDKKSSWDKILGIAAPLSSMTGVPVGNIARDIGNFVKTVSHGINDDLEHTHGLKYAFNEGMWGEKKLAEYYEIMRDKQKKGDTQGYTELKEYLMGRGKTEKEIESGVKAAYSKSKPVAKQTDDYFALLAKNALFGNLPEEKQADVKTAVKRYLTESAMNAATGKEMSKTNQKAAEAQKNGSSAVNYFLAKASFEDTDNSGGISNEEKIAAINKMNISAFEKQALIMLYTKK